MLVVLGCRGTSWLRLCTLLMLVQDAASQPFTCHVHMCVSVTTKEGRHVRPARTGAETVLDGLAAAWAQQTSQS